MIRVYADANHAKIIDEFLTSINLGHEIYTIHNMPKDELKPFDLGVSYSFPRKIPPEVIRIPTKGFVNYHAAPISDHDDLTNFMLAIKEKKDKWAVSVTRYNNQSNRIDIIKIMNIKLHEPCIAIEQLSSISYWFLFHLFKQTIVGIFEGRSHSEPIVEDVEETFVGDLLKTE